MKIDKIIKFTAKLSDELHLLIAQETVPFLEELGDGLEMNEMVSLFLMPVASLMERLFIQCCEVEDYEIPIEKIMDYYFKLIKERVIEIRNHPDCQGLQ